jgi:hypothetical protein
MRRCFGQILRDYSPPDDEQNDTLEESDIHWENCPPKRKPRVTSSIVCLLAAVGIFFYAGYIDTTVIEYQRDDHINSSFILSKVKICYTRNEKKTYPIFFNLGVGLFGIILGTVVDRSCMFFEELFQLRKRYDGKRWKACKACFSGICWKAVGIVTGVLIFSAYFGRKTPYETIDVIYILGGIGVGPLVIYLLNLNSTTEVHVSRVLEKVEMSPGYTLAWSYYFSYLKPELQKFHAAILKVQRNKKSLPKETKKLSFNKLLLLLPPRTDLTSIDILTSYDDTIIKHPPASTSENPYPFPIYHLSDSLENKYLAMICVKQPVIVLRAMRHRAKSFTEDSWKEEIKRFYAKLSEILQNAPNDECSMMSVVVPIEVASGDREHLRNGQLSNIIMRKTKEYMKESKSQDEDSSHPSDDGNDPAASTSRSGNFRETRDSPGHLTARTPSVVEEC